MARVKKVKIHSIKCSLKLPVRVELDVVAQSFQIVGSKIKRYPTFIVISQLPADPDDKHWNPNCKLTLFRYRNQVRKMSFIPIKMRQHCNICGLKSIKSLAYIEQILGLLTDCDPSDMKRTIDNICGTKKLPLPIIKSDFVLANRRLCFSQFESFPGIILKTPNAVTVLVYATASCVFKGAKSMTQLQKANEYVVKCFRRYVKVLKSNSI